MNGVTRHPDLETLISHIDDDLVAAESTAVIEHLHGCDDCRSRLQMIQETLDDYSRFHRDLLKPSLPPPPRAWSRLDFPRTASTRFRITRFSITRWLAVATAIAAVFLLVRRFEQAPEVRAAELLRRAAVAEQAAPPSRVRIRNRARTVDRVARPAGTSAAAETRDVAALHAVFDAARYGWDDPLSAAAFSRWRDTLSRKQDQIEESAGVLLIRTTSPEGVLSDAALTLRAADLHAVACTLRLRSTGETIDMTELPPETLPARAVPIPQRAAPAAPANIASVGDELRVIAALHGSGADLGEPVDVQRAGAQVLVRISGLDEKRRNQIRAALSGIAIAEVRVEDVRGTDSRAPLAASRSATPADTINPLISDLHARDELIDSTDRAAERAYALRALGRRFPTDATSQLASTDAETLRRILGDHVSALVAAIQEIRRLVAAILPNSVPPEPALKAATWQALAGDLPAAVEHLDRILNGGVSDAAIDDRKAELAETIAELDRQLAALKSLL